MVKTAHVPVHAIICAIACCFPVSATRRQNKRSVSSTGSFLASLSFFFLTSVYINLCVIVLRKCGYGRGPGMLGCKN